MLVVARVPRIVRTNDRGAITKDVCSVLDSPAIHKNLSRKGMPEAMTNRPGTPLLR
jgi:hypothetical protein